MIELEHGKVKALSTSRPDYFLNNIIVVKLKGGLGVLRYPFSFCRTSDKSGTVREASQETRTNEPG